MFETPILFIIFNRLETTKEVFATIQKIKPKKLFVAADGARIEKEGEFQKCKEVRDYVIDNIDWDCEVKTLFREQNMGCHPAVTEAITWFFEHVEQGIILEDDVLPEETFFPYCEELLEYYKGNDKVGMISGDNFQHGKSRTKDSYYFCAYAGIWGWAGWRDKWNKFEGHGKNIDRKVLEKNLPYYFSTVDEQQHWLKHFDQLNAQDEWPWDIAWGVKLWEQKKLSVQPDCNLISNLGFGEGATHTTSEDHKNSKIPTLPLKFPLKFPKEIKPHKEAILYNSEYNYGIYIKRSLINRIFRKIKRILLSNK